jgi:hypothetical protein
MPRIRFGMAAAALLMAVCASAATFSVTNTNDSGPGSLRQAILDANSAAGGIVAFNIPSTPRTITPLLALPLAEAGVTIDGTTQPGYLGSPLIEINGASIPNTGFQACISTRGTVRGLVINRCQWTGILGYGAPVIAANYIGTDRTGQFQMGNGTGIRLQGSGSGPIIGGNSFAEGNLISGNGSGVASDFVSDMTISHNKIGMDVSGTRSIPNGAGLFLNDGSNITITSNVISGNYYGTGIQTMLVSNMTIKNNTFGVGTSGDSLPNGTSIQLFVTDSTTVGDLSGGGNVIANSNTGVLVIGDNGIGVRNVIRGNSMYNNNIGINLVRGNSIDGATPNDPGDADIGGNMMQNYPLLTKVASTGGTTTIVGTFNSTPGQTFTIDFYSDTTPCNTTGQGRSYVGSVPLTTDGAGNATINTTFGFAVTPGNSLAALATDSSGNTSEFSPCAAIQGNGSFRFASDPNVNVAEGAGSLVLAVSRVNGSIGSASVNYATANGTAVAGSDYTAASGTLSFADGETQKTITIPIVQDTIFEGTETFSVMLSNGTGGATVGTPSKVTISILDDDPPPVLTISDARMAEGNSGTTPMLFNVTLSFAVNVPVSVDYYTNSITAYAYEDFVYTSGRLTFNPGETQKTISVPIIGDTRPEADETFAVVLCCGITNATYARSYATGTIVNDDAPLTITVSDARVVEGNSGITNAVITLTANAPIYGYLYYSTSDGTARANEDYIPVSDYVYFYSTTTRTITVPIKGDTEPEPDETFTIRFGSNSTGAALDRPFAVVTIVNDDTGFGPRAQSVPRGRKASFVLVVGVRPSAPVTVALASSNPAVLDVPPTLTVTEASTSFEFLALDTGTTIVTVTLPPPYSATFTGQVTVHEPAYLVLTPSAMTIPDGTTLTVSAAFDPPLTKGSLVRLRALDPSIIDVPSSIVIDPGKTTTFAVKSLKKGSTALSAMIAPDHGGAENTYLVDVIEPAATPAIAQIVPAIGPMSGRTSVTVNGANLRSDCTLLFGGTPATDIAFVSATAMTATTPPHPAGTVDVLLNCGADHSTFSNGFTYLSTSPTVSSVSPSFGSTAGGTLVRITGADLRSGCWPFFDGIAARSANFVSPAEMISEAPPHAAGRVPVAIRCSGSADGTLFSAFTYSTAAEPAPLINSITPPAGAPGQPVTLGGARFRRDDTVKFDDAAAAIVSTSPDVDVVTIPLMAAGEVSITLTDAAGRSTTTGPIFNVLEPEPPRIARLTPTSARPGGDVVVDGSGFRPGYSFAFGTARAALVSLSYTRVLLRVPAIAPGTVPLNVLNSAGHIASIGPSFTIASTGPSIRTILPGCATTDGGGTLIITGDGFAAGAVVTFDGTMSSGSVVDANTLRVTIPAGAVGTPRIVVTNPDGTSASLSGVFAYYSPFDPNGGCTGGRKRPAAH